MSVPVRIQLRRVAGWRMPENTVSVARPTLWGNPFWVSPWRDVATCIALFEDAMGGGWHPATSAHLPPAWSGYDEGQRWIKRWRERRNEHPRDALGELRDKNLACWCKLDGTPCHADVLLRLANPETFA